MRGIWRIFILKKHTHIRIRLFTWNFVDAAFLMHNANFEISVIADERTKSAARGWTPERSVLIFVQPVLLWWTQHELQPQTFACLTWGSFQRFKRSEQRFCRQKKTSQGTKLCGQTQTSSASSWFACCFTCAVSIYFENMEAIKTFLAWQRRAAAQMRCSLQAGRSKPGRIREGTDTQWDHRFYKFNMSRFSLHQELVWSLCQTLQK